MLNLTQLTPTSAAAYKKAFAYAEVLKSLDNTKYDQNPEEGEVLIDEWSNYDFDLTPDGRTTSKAKLTYRHFEEEASVTGMCVTESRDSSVLAPRCEEYITLIENPYGGPNSLLTQVRYAHDDPDHDFHKSNLYIDPKGNVLQQDESSQFSSQYRQSMTYRGVSKVVEPQLKPTWDDAPEYAPNATWRMSG